MSKNKNIKKKMSKEEKRIAALSTDELLKEIKLELGNTSLKARKLGILLTVLKDKTEHGEFGTIVKEQFGISRSTASNYMRVGKLFSSKDVKLFDSQCLYFMVQKGFPTEVRKHVLLKAHEGEVWTREAIEEEWAAPDGGKGTESDSAKSKGKGIKKSPETKASATGITKTAKFISDLRSVRDDLTVILKKGNRPNKMPHGRKVKAKSVLDEIVAKANKCKL